jgi:hypothetical protein
MSMFEFIIIMTALGLSSIGYLLAYKDLKKRAKELSKELEEKENGNEK